MPLTPNARAGLLAAGIVGSLLLSGGCLVGLLALASGPGRSPATSSAPVPAAAPASAGGWDRRALADHLKGAGFPMLRLIRPAGFHDDVYFILDGDVSAEVVEMRRDHGYGTPGVVRVRDLGSAESVREHLRRIGDDEVSTTWGWGRFVFLGAEADLARLRRALK